MTTIEQDSEGLDTDDSSHTSGGLAAWAPSVMPGIGRDLTPAQELACSLRHLDDIGFCESYTGHITWQLPGTEPLLVNPWGLWWAETSARDILTIDLDGRVLDGPWDVTPAFHIHTELHRRRPDARVVIHNHPMYGTLLACTGQLPQIIHQNSAMFADELVFIDEYDGEVASADLGASLADAMGDASVAVLASHGVLVAGPTIAEATYANPNQRFFPLQNEWNASWAAGASLSYSLGQAMQARAQVKATRADRRQISHQEEQLRRGIALEVTQAYLDRQKALAAIELNGRAVRSSAEAYRVAAELFQAGTATTTDIIEAELARVNATLQEVNARIDLRVATLKLLYSTGRLTPIEEPST